METSVKFEQTIHGGLNLLHSLSASDRVANGQNRRVRSCDHGECAANDEPHVPAEQ